MNQVSILSFAAYLRSRLVWLFLLPFGAGAIALGITFLLTPRFTSTTTFLPPQQSQSSSAAALAALGPLSSLVGLGGAMRTTADQYVSLLQSVTVSDRIVDAFDLRKVYDVELRVAARKILSENVHVLLGKKDGMVIVEVTDTSPQRAADMANQYVVELRRLSASLAITEAQQRRQFFERLLEQTREQLKSAQLELQASGIGAGALKAEPKAAADSYARTRAEVAATEVRLQAARNRLADDTPEVRQLLSTLAALRQQLAKVEQPPVSVDSSDYISKYRNFKYQEALFEVYSRQFELARVDESREGALIQVVDKASPAELRSFPKRTRTAVTVTLVVAVLQLAWLYARQTKQARRQGAV